MGFKEEKKQTTPPPWGWPAPQKKNAHSIEEIVYHGTAKTTKHTKDRRYEQEKVYHKTRSGATPDRQAAHDTGYSMEWICKPMRANITAALCKGPQHPVRYMAARIEARSSIANHQARQPLDIPRIRHRQGEGLHKRRQEQYGSPDEAHSGNGHTIQTCRAEAKALPVRCENDDHRSHARQGHSMPQDILQPHRGRRHGRVLRADAVPSRTTTKTSPASARGKNGSRQEADQGQTKRGLGSERAWALGNGHGSISKRFQRRTPRNARQMLKALCHRAPEPH